MKLSNLLAHCLLGLVDCSSSLVLPKAKNSIPVQIFIPNSSNTDCGEEVVIFKKKNWKLFYSLTHCVAVWPDLLLLQCTVVQTTCFNLILNHTGCFFEKISNHLVKITWVEPSFGCFDPFLLRVLIGTFTVHIKEIIRKSDLLQNLETKFQEIKMFSRKLILTCREIS